MGRTFVVLFGWLFSGLAIAQTQTPPDADLAAFLAQVLQVAADIGGMSQIGAVSTVIMLLVGSLKVTVLRRILWDRLGWAKILVAPALGLIAGLLGLGAGGAPVTLPMVLVYLTAGGGAVLLHELLDAFKHVPGLGWAYARAVETIGRKLGAKTAQPGVAQPFVAQPEKRHAMHEAITRR